MPSESCMDYNVNNVVNEPIILLGPEFNLKFSLGKSSRLLQRVAFLVL